RKPSQGGSLVQGLHYERLIRLAAVRQVNPRHGCEPSADLNVVPELRRGATAPTESTRVIHFGPTDGERRYDYRPVVHAHHCAPVHGLERAAEQRVVPTNVRALTLVTDHSRTQRLARLGEPRPTIRRAPHRTQPCQENRRAEWQRAARLSHRQATRA